MVCSTIQLVHLVEIDINLTILSAYIQRLEENNFVGTIHSSLSLLSKLAFFDASNNNLIGSIPNSIASMTWLNNLVSLLILPSAIYVYGLSPSHFQLVFGSQ